MLEPASEVEPPPSSQPESPAGAEERLAELAKADAAGEVASEVPSVQSSPTASLPLIDPRTSRLKFDRELAQYRQMEREYIKRGWLMVRAEYPEIVVVFAAPQLSPRAAIVGVVLDFSNYDLWAPSVKFVDPFTLAPLRIEQMPFQLLKKPRSAPAPGVLPIMQMPQPSGTDANGAETPGEAQAQPLPLQIQFQVQQLPQPLIVAHADGIPFLCIAGVREYHDHPFHSNDPWLAHRGTTVGRLYHILDVIYRYGIMPLKGYKFSINVVAGPPFQLQEEIPE